MKNDKRFYGWTIAVALWFTYLLTAGLAFYGASVINAAMSKSLQLDKTTIGVGFSVLSLVWGFSGPLSAFLLNRIGVRLTVTVGSLIVAAGSLLLGLVVNSGWMFIGVFGVINGIGIGIASNLPTQTGITLWFQRKRALVLSLVLTASGIGGFLAPPLFNRIVVAADWQAAWLVITGTSLLSAAIAAIFLRDRPADLGQWPDGVAPLDNAPAAQPETRWTPAALLRNPTFWQILGAGIVFAAPIPMLVAHGVSHLEGIGHPPATAAWALGLMLLCSVPGRVLGGFLCDRFAPRYVWAGMLLMIAAGIAIVIHATSMTEIALFAGLMGVGFGASIICWVSIIASYFGAASFPTVMGMQTPIQTLLVSSVPAVAGVIYDQVGTFSLTLWTLATALLLGAIMIMWARAPQQPIAIAASA